MILSYAQYRSETHVQWQNAQVGFPAFEIKSKGDVLSHVLGVLMTILNFSDFLGRICRTQHIAIPMAKIYYGEKIQSRINKGKGTGAVSGGNQAQTSKNPLPGESYWMHLILLVIPDKFCLSLGVQGF